MLRYVQSTWLIGGLVTAWPVLAGELQAEALRAHCRAEIAPTGQLCDCVLRQFAKLTEDQQALVAAMVSNDAVALAAASVNEREEAESFLKRETLLCRPSG
jgi:hypothetical protein